ncbi:hypothetical protein ARMA_1239 [Ardenticatena maritima]|uniref:Uncharacterized protein n=1 Tax=Ardenticatena maritima TaxID=872965 RepID=A0A0M8K943_9CHLR|nr:hypothetical protein ARMA_1239 [Ardenticatena maritima]
MPHEEEIAQQEEDNQVERQVFGTVVGVDEYHRAERKQDAPRASIVEERPARKKRHQPEDRHQRHDKNGGIRPRSPAGKHGFRPALHPLPNQQGFFSGGQRLVGNEAKRQARDNTHPGNKRKQERQHTGQAAFRQQDSHHKRRQHRGGQQIEVGAPAGGLQGACRQKHHRAQQPDAQPTFAWVVACPHVRPLVFSVGGGSIVVGRAQSPKRAGRRGMPCNV